MKRFILFTLLLCAFCSGMIAQDKDFFKENRHEVRLSYGSVNTDIYYDRFTYPYRYYYNRYGYGYGYGRWGQLNRDYDGNYKTAGIYAGPTKTTGVLSGSYAYNLPGIRFSFGSTFSYSGYSTDLFNRIDGSGLGSIKGHTIAITPTVRYAWLSKGSFRLYSGIGLSFYWDLYRLKQDSPDHSASSKVSKNYFDGALMVAPVGFTFGKKLFITGEANLGGRTGSFVGGVGYRF